MLPSQQLETQRGTFLSPMTNKSDIEKAIAIVKCGGIIIYPTDTAFGIGCRIDSKEAIDRLFQIRKRPVTQALPVLVSSISEALAYFASPSNIVRHLMESYWPGALTIIDRCKKDILYSPICGGGDTVGIRWPDHEVPEQIIKGVGLPMVGPSANIHDQPTPYAFEELDKDLVKNVDFVVPGVCKGTKKASTVVDCTTVPYTIIRQGSIIL